MALITTTETAERLGVIQSRIRQLILREQLPAQKFGRDWMIDEADLHIVEGRKNGRPRKENDSAATAITATLEPESTE